MLRLMFAEFDTFFDRLAKGLKRTVVRFFARILSCHPENRAWSVDWRHVEINTAGDTTKVLWT